MTEIAAKHGVRALPVACNVSHWEQRDALAERAYAEFGRVDIPVDNADLPPLHPSPCGQRAPTSPAATSDR